MRHVWQDAHMLRQQYAAKRFRRWSHYSSPEQGSLYSLRCCRVATSGFQARDQVVQGLQELSGLGSLW